MENIRKFDKIDKETQWIEGLMERLNTKYSKTTFGTLFYGFVVVPILLLYLVLYSAIVVLRARSKDNGTKSDEFIVESYEQSIDNGINITKSKYKKENELVNMENKMNVCEVSELEKVK